MKKLLTCALAAAVCLSAFALPSCAQEDTAPKAADGRAYVMGTEAVLHIAADFSDQAQQDKFTGLWTEVKALLNSVEASVSVEVETSSVSRFNAAAAGAKVRIDETAYEILRQAISYCNYTDGYFNPAVYQSLRAYGIESGKITRPESLPAAETVAAYKTLAESFTDIVLTEQDGGYYATKPAATVTAEGEEHSLMLDLGGIGKGWCADRIDELIESYGFEYGYFSFGSSTMAVKKYNSETVDFYKLTARDPRGDAGSSYVQFPVKDVCLSTSGDYELYYEIDGVRYCHIIDPTTGSPIQTGIASVTIVGGSAAQDDALTTALSAMGKQKAVDFINDNLSDRTVVMLVIEDGNGIIITNRPEDVTVRNSAYTLGNTVKDGKIILG